jgi:hypothetical protein
MRFEESLCRLPDDCDEIAARLTGRMTGIVFSAAELLYARRSESDNHQSAASRFVSYRCHFAAGNLDIGHSEARQIDNWICLRLAYHSLAYQSARC